MKISHIILGLLCFAILFFIGRAISVLPFKISLVLIIGFIFSALTLINLETGLFFLIFVVPFTQQITLAKFGKLPVDVGTDDLLILFIIFSWLASLAKRKEPLFLRTSLNWPIFVFFAAGMFSFIGAGMRFGEGVVLVGILHLLKFFEYVVIYFIVISTINNLQQVKKFLFMFFIVTGVIIVVQFIAMLQYGHFSLATPLKGSYYLLYMRSLETFTSNAILGAYYSFFLSILLALILNTPVSEGRVSLILFTAILSFALFNTFSRAAYLGLVVSFSILALLRERRFLLIILLLVVFSPIYMQSAVLERLTITVQAFRPTIILEESAAIRLFLWKKAMDIFLSSPFLGMGYWTTRHFLRAEAHSQYLALLAEIGVVGFSVFCWLIIRMFKNAIVLMKRAETYFLKALATGYIAGFAAILTTCFFSESLEAFRIVGPLWFVTGLISSANRLLSEKSGKLDIDST